MIFSAAAMRLIRIKNLRLLNLCREIFLHLLKNSAILCATTPPKLSCQSAGMMLKPGGYFLVRLVHAI